MATNLIRGQPNTLASLGTVNAANPQNSGLSAPARAPSVGNDRFKPITGHSNDEAFGHNIFMATNGMFSEGDPRLQELIDGGYIEHRGGGGGDGGDNGQYVITEKAPQRELFTGMAPTNPDGGGAGGSGMLNPRAVKWDPFYGNITSLSNMAPAKTTALDVIGPMAPMLLAGGIGAMGGLGANAGGVGGWAGASQALGASGAASSLPNAARTLGGGGSLNPVTLATLGAGLGGYQVPQWASTLAQLGYGASQGRTPSPMSAIGPGVQLLSRLGS